TMTNEVAQMDYDKRAELVRGFDYPAFEAKEGPDRPVELVLLGEQGNDDPAEDPSDAAANPGQSVSAAQRQAAWVAQRIQNGSHSASKRSWVPKRERQSFRSMIKKQAPSVMSSTGISWC
ncbi:MAG: hypothetical protein ACYS9H_08150, partial [Planctomycetota bacterium]